MEKLYRRRFWPLVLPAVLCYTLILVIPFFIGILYSFTSWRGTYFAGGSLCGSFVGFENYAKVFSGGKFGYSLVYTAGYAVIAVILLNVIALGMALLINSITKGAGALRTVLFMPKMLGGLAMGFVWQFIFQVIFTDILFGEKGIFHAEFLTYMTQDPKKALFALAIMNTWSMAGYLMLMYVIGLNAIPGDVYEAASIDGANAWQTFFKIKLPLLMPSITISLFLVISDSFKMLDQNVALTNGDYNTRMLALQILRTIQDSNPPNYGVAQAQAVIFFLIVATISIVQVSVTRSKEVQM